MIQKLNRLLRESRGFAARKVGDEFVDPQNREDTATYQGLTRLPPSEISYPTNADLVTAYQEWKSQAEGEGKVFELNKPTSVIRGAMIVTMNSARGTEYFVLFVRDLKILEGKLTSIPPGVISPDHGGYVLNRATALSERAGLKPGDIISGKKHFSPSQVSVLLNDARPVAGDEAVDQMQSYLQALAQGKGVNFVIKDGAKNASLHQKYLGEWAAPIALITSQFSPESQLKELELNMIGGKSVASGKIQYNTATAEPLVDSVVVVSGDEIAISSKAHKGGGAAASLKGLADTITKKQQEFGAEFWADEKNSQFRNVVDVITSKSAIDGVLDLSQEQAIIPRSDVSKIKDLIDDPNSKVKLTTVTRRLMAGYAANENHPQYNEGKHALASVARALCDKLNAEDYTSSAKAILNKSNVVQMNFVTGVRGPDLICKEFTLIWPPNFEGVIKFYSGKNFSATEIKGKLGFKITPFKTSVEEPDESLQAPSLSAVDLLKKKREAERSVGKIVKRGARDMRDVSVPDVVALGRELKKPE